MTAPQTVADVPIVATLSGLDAILQTMEARSDFGSRVILIQNDEYNWRDDYLAGLTMIDGNRQRHGFEPNDLLCWPRKDDVTHTFSPAPVSKRRARRLRAALRAAATSARQGENQ